MADESTATIEAPPVGGEPISTEAPTIPTWRQQLPEPLRESPALGNFNDPASMAQAYVDLLEGRKSDKPWHESVSESLRPQAEKFKTPDDLVKELVAAQEKANQPFSWRDRIPEEMRDDPILKNVPDDPDEGLATLAKRVIDLQKTVSRGTVSIPGKDATQEERDAFYTKLGRPEKPDGYEVPTENMPKDVPLNEELLAKFRDEAFEMGLSKQNAARLIRFQAQMIADAQENGLHQQKQAALDAERELRKEWGPNFDDQLKIAEHSIKTFGDDGFVDFLEESGLRNDPRFIKFLHKVGSEVVEDEIKGFGGRQQFGMTPSAAQTKYSELMSDEKFRHMYLNGHVPGHKDAVEQVNRLQQIIHHDGRSVELNSVIVGNEDTVSA